ncbi:hypothetical protein GCM10010191_26150 [Actinomadura vinacea]|uniref:Uncharacterized protein n=1 Tax=Actinomadura vinacea TaxID=115336 RepID=A0ABN3IUV3_9ACTN
MRRQALAALVMVPVLAFGTSACGGADAQGKSGTPNAKAASDQEKLREFAKCMRANGVDMPDPSGDGRVTVKMSGKPGSQGMAKMDEAQRKCRKLMPNGGKPPKPKPEDLAKMREEAKCMRANGVPDFPDPEPDGGFKINSRKGGSLDSESQTFQKAQKKCGGSGPRRTVPLDGGK